MKSYLWPLIRQIAITVLKLRPIPRHVSLIPDGHRTYFRKVGGSLRESCEKGVDIVIKQIQTCSELNVPIISVFVFSETNFQRKRDEVEHYYRSIVTLFHKISEHPYGGRYKIIGDMTRFPDYFRSAGIEMENATCENNKFLVYLAIGYAGKNELTEIAMNIQRTISRPTEVTLELVDKFLYIPHSDCISTLTIRSSNIKRLSGFLPWQNSFSIMYLVSKLWPEFTDWDMFKAVLYFQRHLSP